jgi:type II secretory pathway pseudopilin PulG
MAVLLVAMSIMAIMLMIAMPVWKHTAQREKEEELVFRGTQYVHAIALFQRKTANAYPPNIDLLVRERYLRKKYKDPITNDDFQPLYAAGQGPNRGNNPQGAVTGGGIIGVTSKSKETSIRVFNGATHYNEWQAVYVNTAPGRGRGGPPPNPNNPGFPGGPGRGPGGPGRGPGGPGRGFGTPGVMPFPGMPPQPVPGGGRGGRGGRGGG